MYKYAISTFSPLLNKKIVRCYFIALLQIFNKAFASLHETLTNKPASFCQKEKSAVCY